ncbi:MAG: tRNA glutamyl-Q(34) synthetase GluQRS [Rhizobiales bacterium]|nr:tRNA glutamyl-Q(34) synthetase GluQRS [Hyphomicrobiales bacterium]MBI3674773.1 tRNA glutamyl-Q(34) synthetase GluQRS [Hyphomicrobiales bacterium]
MAIPAFRFAPSPNGELHLGHAYSALLNVQLAAEAGGRFLVRIEDIDTTRCTPELAEKALADLAWLGLSWEQPVRVQSRHLADYSRVQERLAGMGLLYPCFCSRREIVANADPARRDPEGQPPYPGTCRALPCSAVEARIASGEPHALRLDMGAATIDPAALAWGDVVLVRKDIATSYHVAVVTDDHLQGISHVVRGKDLEAATAIHVVLQRLLGYVTPHYHHHELIGDETGRKLSKSEGASSLCRLRAEGVTPAEIRRALGFA